jgi:broad specificity phosphatase PhoE
VFLIRHGQTEFNRVFSATRRDPAIRDPSLTELGRLQATAIARVLGLLSPRRLITSPYLRALETAEIVAEQLGLPITIEPLVAERFCFACDIGSPLAELRARWPDLDFDHLPDPWWPQLEETEEQISRRSESFRYRIQSEVWSEIAVVTHWGFIRALAGLKVPNGAVLRIDPSRLDHKPEVVLFPDPA